MDVILQITIYYLISLAKSNSFSFMKVQKELLWNS